MSESDSLLSPVDPHRVTAVVIVVAPFASLLAYLFVQHLLSPVDAGIVTTAGLIVVGVYVVAFRQ